MRTLRSEAGGARKGGGLLTRAKNQVVPLARDSGATPAAYLDRGRVKHEEHGYGGRAG